MDKEIRMLQSQPKADGRRVEGCAIKFNSRSQYLGFYEEILPEACTQEFIDTQDVLALFDHDDSRGILARWNKGVGNLKLEVRSDGLYYSFDALPTQLGDEVLEYIKSGIIEGSSFAFCVDSNDESAQEWERKSDGNVYRTIKKFKMITDVSAVVHPAYLQTSCSCRSYDKFLEEEKELEEQRETPTEKPQKEDEIPTEDKPKEEKSCEGVQKKKEERVDDEEPQEDTPTDETKEESKEEDRNLENNNKVINNNKMEKRYSLMKELRSALETGKSFNLNDVESRAYTVTAEGEDVVQTDIYDIWEPLRAKNVLVQAGAKTITGIKNNVQIPLMSAVSANWAGETAAATDGSGTFTSKKLSPKRITAKYPISLQLLAQDSIGIENAIRSDIQRAINSKLEATLLSNAAGTDDQPEGLFHTPETATTIVEISTFADVCNLEGSVEEANFDDGVYIMSPKAKAALRNMAKSAKSTQLVMEGGQVDGTDAFVTSHVADKKMIYGDFSNLVIATWDNVMIDVVRDTASVGNGMVTIVVNAFCDAALVRPEALAFAKIKE